MIQGSRSLNVAEQRNLDTTRRATQPFFSFSLLSLYHLLSHFSPPSLSPYLPHLPPLSSPLTSNFFLTLSTPSLPHSPLLRHLGLDLVPRKDFEMVDEDQISVSDLYKMVRFSAMEPLEPFGTYQTFLIYRS